MDFEEFSKSIIKLSDEQSDIKRREYISQFIDTQKEYYKKYIEELRDFVDGRCYTGYLWDCLKDPRVISFKELELGLRQKGEVYVFWDIHSKEKIFIEDYWKFGKDTVLLMKSEILLKGLEYLPEDIYIFDRNMAWTIALTHEYDNEHRWCFQSHEV
jgi:hypothetical protein